MRRIKQGDEVTVSYLNESKGVMSKQERNDLLWRRYLFKCR